MKEIDTNKMENNTSEIDLTKIEDQIRSIETLCVPGEGGGRGHRLESNSSCWSKKQINTSITYVENFDGVKPHSSWLSANLKDKSSSSVSDDSRGMNSAA